MIQQHFRFFKAAIPDQGDSVLFIDRFRAHDDGQKLHIAAGRGSGEASACSIGSTGLAAGNPIIIILAFLRIHHIIGGDDLPRFTFVGSGNGIAYRAEHLLELWDLQRKIQNAANVPGGGIHTLVMQAVDIGVVCSGAAQFRRPVIHHLNELILRTADMLGNDRSRIVGGSGHQAIQQAFQRQLLARHQLGADRAHRHIGQGPLGDHHFIFQVTLFQRN